MAATQAAKEMRRYLKMDEVEANTIQIEDLEETIVNAFEDIEEDEDETAEVRKTKKDKEARIKNLLIQTTQAHELLAQFFLEAHLRMEGKFLFPHDHDTSDSEEN
jgi:formamidopyrimidine-DNA glycosylase